MPAERVRQEIGKSVLESVIWLPSAFQCLRHHSRRLCQAPLDQSATRELGKCARALEVIERGNARGLACEPQSESLVHPAKGLDQGPMEISRGRSYRSPWWTRLKPVEEGMARGQRPARVERN